MASTALKATRKTVARTPAATPAATPKAAPRATQATKRANASAAIDFAAARTAEQFTGPTGRTSPWVNKVRELVAGVQAGTGKYGVFYRLGVFTSASGARTTIRNLAKQTTKLPSVLVDFAVESTVNDGVKGSELWASVRAPVTPVDTPSKG